MNVPVDEAHEIARRMLIEIRTMFAAAHDRVAAWQPRPCPPKERST